MSSDAPFPATVAAAQDVSVARMLTSHGKFDEAATLLRRSLARLDACAPSSTVISDIPPVTLDVLFALSSACFATGATLDALSLATRLVECSPNASRGYKALGTALCALNRVREGLRAFATGRIRALDEPPTLASVLDFDRLIADATSRLGLGSEGVAEPTAAGGAAGESDSFAALEAWLSSRSSSAFPFLYMQTYSENNRGVHARADIGADCEVMVIGREFLITVELARASSIGRKIAAHDLDLSAGKHCFLAAFVLWDRRNPSSFFQPYYAILPSAYPNMPVYWNEEELSWLQGSFIQEQIADRKRNIRQDYDEICAVVPEFRDIASAEDFLWARMMVASRNFGILVDGVRTDALVPYADMLNHFRPRQTRWAYDDRKRAFVIHSLHKLQAGQQIYDSYGKKCNSRFLLNYGFTVDYNRDDDVGQNNNEVRLLFKMLPPGEDPLYLQKLRIHDGLLAFEDSAYGHPALRTAAATSEALSHRAVPSRGIRLSTYYDAEGTTEAFSYLRFVHARTYEDTLGLPRPGNAEYDFIRKSIAPLSVENETKVLDALAHACAEQLRKYPTTLAEDVAELESGRWPMYSNRRNAIVLVKGEKEVAHYYIALREEASRLLHATWEEVQAAISTGYTSGSDRDKYVRNVVSRLVQQRHEATRAGGSATAVLTSDSSPSMIDGMASPTSARSRSASGAGHTPTSSPSLRASVSWRSNGSAQ